MAELKPCPFCGGKAKYVYSMPFNSVQCRKCKAWGKTIVDSYEQQDGKQAAIEAWNRRTTIETNIYDKEEIYPNCTVQVLTNTVTGEVSVGWWKNGGSEPTEIDFDYEAEDE